MYLTFMSLKYLHLNVISNIISSQIIIIKISLRLPHNDRKNKKITESTKYTAQSFGDNFITIFHKFYYIFVFWKYSYSILYHHHRIRSYDIKNRYQHMAFYVFLLSWIQPFLSSYFNNNKKRIICFRLYGVRLYIIFISIKTKELFVDALTAPWTQQNTISFVILLYYLIHPLHHYHYYDYIEKVK